MCTSAPAAGQDGPPWYDASELPSSVRASARRGLPRAAGVARLEELTLYDLDLDLNLDRRSYDLQERIWFSNRGGGPLREIVLRVYGNAVAGPAPVELRGGACRGRPCTVEAEGPTTLVVRLATPLRPGERLRVDLHLRGRLRVIDSSRTNVLSQGLESLTNLGSAERTGGYGLLAVGDGIASFANFYAVVARRRSGNWVRGDDGTMGDQGPDALAHVRARIRVDRGVRVATTGVVASRRMVDGRQELSVVAGMVRDFAILASRRFETATRRVGDVVVRSHFLGAERAAGERVLDVAAESLAVFERRFGPYPYADLDVVEAPLVGGAGGVEFAGLVTVASMFYRPAASGPMAALLGPLMGGGGAGAQGTQDRMLEFVTAHEVAHQYWHGLVGSDSREHPFVDESLAQFSAVLYLEDRYGETRAEQDADMQVAMNYRMMRMLGEPDGRVDQPVSAFSSPLVYAGLVYGKGPGMYRAMREAVGDRVFFAALRDYVRRYAFKTAPDRGLVDLLARGPNGARVRRLARRWLEETHGDEDVGGADISGMLSTLLGGGAAGGGAAGNAGASGGAAIDSAGLGELEQVMRMLEGMGGGGAAGGGAGGAAPSQEELERTLQQMLRGLGQ